jgi:hypothetical protein
MNNPQVKSQETSIIVNKGLASSELVLDINPPQDSVHVVEKTKIEKRWLKGKSQYLSWVANALYLLQINDQIEKVYE